MKNGDRYEGPFFNDARNGIGGKYYFATGDLYIGDYVDDIKEGNGEYMAKVTTPCKDVATSGKYRYFEGDHYIGQYHKNNRHGIGKQWSKNGNLYEGEWVDHYRSGRGTLTLANGEYITFDGNDYHGTIDGLWERDKLLKILPKVEVLVDDDVVSNAAPNETLVAAAAVDNTAADDKKGDIPDYWKVFIENASAAISEVLIDSVNTSQSSNRSNNSNNSKSENTKRKKALNRSKNSPSYGKSQYELSANVRHNYEQIKDWERRHYDTSSRELTPLKKPPSPMTTGRDAPINYAWNRNNNKPFIPDSEYSSRFSNSPPLSSRTDRARSSVAELFGTNNVVLRSEEKVRPWSTETRSSFGRRF